MAVLQERRLMVAGGCNRAILFLVLFAGQAMQVEHKQVVRLQPHSNFIQAELGGKRIELLNSPAVLYLLALPPKVDAQGNPWAVEVVNLGPSSVTVLDKSRFRVQIGVRETVHIHSNGIEYVSSR
jgi:hypothetical protein